MDAHLITYIGRMFYFSHLRNNLLDHCIEVAKIAKVISEEIGLNKDKVIRAGILHDIGKTVDSSIDGTHAKVGAELAKRYGEDDIVVNAILYHHDAKVDLHPISSILQASNNLSNQRPGSIHANINQYVSRLEKLEEIALGFPEVDSAYALQAGRELRVITSANKLDDNELVVLARDIALSIEKLSQYTGRIKVTVSREVQVIEYTR
jgi:ribonucrease Y